MASTAPVTAPDIQVTPTRVTIQMTPANARALVDELYALTDGLAADGICDHVHALLGDLLPALHADALKGLVPPPPADLDSGLIRRPADMTNNVAHQDNGTTTRCGRRIDSTWYPIAADVAANYRPCLACATTTASV